MLLSRSVSTNALGPRLRGAHPFRLIGWDVFNLDYSVKFPLSLVLSRKSITYYQMIFRHLLRLRQLERIFQDTWTEHLKTPSWRNRSPYPELQSWKGRVFALRARMYDFIQQMFDFAVSEVLEVRWGELRKKLERCETVDQLLKDHDNFLNTCTNECLLTNEKLLEVRSFLARRLPLSVS